MFHSLRIRMALINAAAMLLVIGCLAAGLLAASDGLLKRQETVALQAQTQSAAHEFTERGDEAFRLGHDAYESGTFYLLWAPDGAVAFNSANVPTGPLAAAARSAPAGSAGVREVELAGQDTLVASQTLADGSRLQVGRSLEPMRRLEGDALLLLLAFGAFGAVLSLLAGWLLAGRAVRPIEEAFERQRRFAADASHELRTPLATIDAGIQVLTRHPEQTIGRNRDVLESAAREIARLRRLIDDLLVLARADSGQLELELRETDLDRLLEGTVADMRRIAEAGGHRLEMGKGRAGMLLADGDRLRQLLLILLDNAIAHTPPGTTITVSAARAGEREVELTVADDGPGIAPELRPQALRRFHRLREGRSTGGAGLGLAIAVWLAEAHGGSLRLLDNHPGLKVQVVLPASGRRGARAAPLAKAGAR